MAKITTLLLSALLFISTAVFAVSTSDKAVSSAKKKTADFVQVVELNAGEEAKVYKVLLAKEQNTLAAMTDYKGVNRPLRRQLNLLIKIVIVK